MSLKNATSILNKSYIPNRSTFNEEDKLVISKNKEKETYTRNSDTNLNYTRHVKLNFSRATTGNNLNYQACSMEVVEERVAIMDQDQKPVKDPTKVKMIADNTVDAYYKERVKIGDGQLAKKTGTMRKSASPINVNRRSKSPKNGSGSKKGGKIGKWDWDNGVSTDGLRPQFPNYSLIDDKTPNKNAKKFVPKEIIKYDPYLITKRDPKVKYELQYLQTEDNNKKTTNPNTNMKYDETLDMGKEKKMKNKDYYYFYYYEEYLGESKFKNQDFNYRKTVEEEQQEEEQKYRGASLNGTIRMSESEDEEEPEDSDFGEETEEDHIRADSDNDNDENLFTDDPQSTIHPTPNNKSRMTLQDINEEMTGTRKNINVKANDAPVITEKNSFLRLNRKKVVQKKRSALQYWEKLPDHPIIFKVDESYSILIEELLKAGWVQSKFSGVESADFIYGKDAFNLEFHSSLKPEQYIGQFRDNLVTMPRGLMTALPKYCKLYNKDMIDFTYYIYKIFNIDTFYRFICDYVAQQMLGVLYASEKDLSGNNYAKFFNMKVRINFNYREDIDWPFLNWALQYVKGYFLEKKPMTKIMTLLRLLVDKGFENPLTEYTREVVERYLINYYKKYNLPVYESLGDYDDQIDLGKPFEVKECDAFMKDYRGDGYRVFSSNKFCRQSKGCNLYRMTQFIKGGYTQNSKQYQFLDNLNDIFYRMTMSTGREGVFDDDSFVLQKYCERPVSFQGKLVKIRMICVITSYSPLTVYYYKTLIGFTNGYGFDTRTLNKRYDMMKLEDVYNNDPKNVDDMVFTSGELMDLFQQSSNPTVNTFFKGKFIRDANFIITGAMQSMFGYADARKNTFEVDCWDFVVDEDGSTYLDNVQFSCDLHRIGEGSRKLDKFQQNFWKNFALLFTEYEFEQLSKGAVTQIGNFKLLVHKNFYVKEQI